MSSLLRPLQWFYHAFGIAAIHRTGVNAYVIILARTFRMLSHGATALVLGLFLSELHFSDYNIGLFLTFTLLGDLFLGGLLTLIADRVGRRKVLLAGSLLMIFSGLVLASVENFWILLLAAVFGVVSVTGGDFGPFRSIEESILSQLTTPDTRPHVLGWYVTTATLGSAIGSEASGRVVNYLRDTAGWSLVDAYHALFWSYSAMGLVNVILTLLLSNDCEMRESETAYTRIPQEDSSNFNVANGSGVNNDHDQHDQHDQHDRTQAEDRPAPFSQSRPWYLRLRTSLFSKFSTISSSTRSIMYKLWFLLAVDSLADGMVPYSLTNYYMDIKFHPSKSTLGDATGGAYLLGAISTLFAGPLAHKIGLINTMVFTHIPSSAAVLVFPWPDSLALTVVLLFVRAGLNNMDQAPRSAFIAAVVRSDERTAVMGITTMVRTLASMAGPTLTGLLAGNSRFWIAFVVAGSCRLAYDLGLYVMFVNVKLYQHEPAAAAAATPKLADDEEEEMTELDRLPYPHVPDLERLAATPLAPDSASPNTSLGGLHPHHPLGRVRRRSPSPLAKPLTTPTPPPPPP